VKPAKVDAHISMTADDRAQLEEWAREECRSFNGQVLYLLRAALAGRHVPAAVESITFSEIDRVRDGTRRAAAKARG